MKVGIIGASFAREAYLPALRHIQDADVVAVCGARLTSAQAAADEFGVPHAYDDWRRMLAEHRFDLVCIATPTDTHAPMALAALDAGAHVLSEKPTAMSAVEARAMLDRAEALGRVHMIDHELRFNAKRRHVKRLVESGAIGKLRHVAIHSIGTSWADPRSRAEGDWWSLAERGWRPAGSKRVAPGRPAALVVRRDRRCLGRAPDDGARPARQEDRAPLDGHSRRLRSIHRGAVRRRARDRAAQHRRLSCAGQ